MESTHTVSSYIIQRLCECGVNHIFGVPGDYVLGFYNQLLHKLSVIPNVVIPSSKSFV